MGRRKVGQNRIIISMPDELLNLLDKAAKNDLTTRSNVVRTALRWYLEPHEFVHADTDKVLKILRQRKGLAALRQTLDKNRDGG